MKNYYGPYLSTCLSILLNHILFLLPPYQCLPSLLVDNSLAAAATRDGELRENREIGRKNR
jgi:hypothetical protein